MTGRRELTDGQWAIVEPLLRLHRHEDNRGRPWHDTRLVLNGVFRVLGTGARWRQLPEKYPPHQTCHRRFQQWIRSGMLEEPDWPFIFAGDHSAHRAAEMIADILRIRQTCHPRYAAPVAIHQPGRHSMKLR